MSSTNKTYIFIAGGVIVLIAMFALWFIFFRSSTPLTSTSQTSAFGSSNNTTSGVSTNTTAQSTNEAQQVQAEISPKKVFKIAVGPIVAATYYEKGAPTTTVARYILATNGHVFDLVLDSAGAIAKSVSNTTIPGIIRALWVEKGNAVLLQYKDAGTLKTVYESFATVSSTTSATQAGRLQFLPDDIADIAVSPDGKNITYLVQTSTGIDGYVTKPDGTNGKKLFSLPLSQILVSWPSSGTLLAQTNSATGIKGIVFSINSTSGAVTPLLYDDGITATADATFSTVVYQTTPQGSSLRTSYAYDVKRGSETNLLFDPSPEKCIWSSATSTTLYCATPLSYVSRNYLDLWHIGVTPAADSIYAYNLTNKQKNTIVAFPGSAVDGGVQTGIISMSLGSGEKYLLYISRSDESLWAVRLTQ